MPDVSAGAARLSAVYGLLRKAAAYGVRALAARPGIWRSNAAKLMDEPDLRAWDASAIEAASFEEDIAESAAGTGCHDQKRELVSLNRFAAM